MKDIDDRKKRLIAMMEELQREEDMTKFLLLAQEMEKVGKELQDVTVAFAAEMKAKEKRTRGAVEVMLTPEQRAKILRETGVSMTTVLIDDPGGEINRAMTVQRPEPVEAEALRQARAQKAARDATENARMAVDRQLRELEEQGELMAQKIAEVRERPDVKAILNPKS